nr:Succinate-semialdehyde dehydrogenase [NAD(P)+] [Kibdelosporangium sp. MJ126-NF4]CTQ90648.1 Succinate-semialdehyde dehydrogenase [NAD(P)+] (EC 1.2.1.16) [Kibdelosporangium sp. MJ126-NF4]
MSAPATETVLATYVGGGARDAAAAADVSAAALPAWAAMTGTERATILTSIAAELRKPETAAELAEITSMETGKRLAEARAEVGMSAAFFDWFATAVRARTDQDLRVAPGHRHRVHMRALGVVVVSTPWNFPLSIPARKIAAALAAGCTVLFKPSEVAAGASLALARLVEAQVPPGVLCTMLGDGATITGVWLADPRVRGISFTGSTRVGLLVADQAMPSFTRCVLELGGNAPVVVMDDADPRLAVELISAAKYRNNGQSCIAANTAWVPRSMLDDVAAGLVADADGLVLGDPLDSSTTLGPLALPTDRYRVKSLAEDARARGATVHRSTAAVPDRGQFTAPVIAIAPPLDAAVVTEESFAPVLAVMPYDNVADVVDWSRRSSMGLAGYVVGTDVDRACGVAEALDVGIVGVNTATPNTPQIPFGGLKSSGLGCEGGQQGLDAFLTPQVIAVAQR